MSNNYVSSMRAQDGSMIKLECHDALHSTSKLARAYAKIGYPDRYVVFSERLIEAGADGQTREVEYLSEGTKDLSYISLRRALTGVLFGGAYPPLIYDESFSRLDETRLRRVLTLLSSREGSCHQSILLTCHKTEAAIAAEVGFANLIRL